MRNKDLRYGDLCFKIRMKSLTIAVDFDGTLVTNEFPKVGATLPKCVDVLKQIVKNKHKLILLTMRSGVTLTPAKEWFELNDIKLYAINRNPQQETWSKSNKIFADVYIDDNNLGIPIFHDRNGKKCVNWDQVEALLKRDGLI